MDRRPFRFGVIAETVHGAGRFTEAARRAEALGYATFLIRDHFVPDVFGDQLAPLPTVAAAAGWPRRSRPSSAGSAWGRGRASTGSSCR